MKAENWYVKVSLDFPAHKRKAVITDDGVLRSNISDAIAKLIEDYYEGRIVGLPAVHLPEIPMIVGLGERVQWEEVSDEKV